MFDAKVAGATPISPHNTFSINTVDAHTWHSILGYLSDDRLCTLKDKLRCSFSISIKINHASFVH